MFEQVVYFKKIQWPWHDTTWTHREWNWDTTWKPAYIPYCPKSSCSLTDSSTVTPLSSFSAIASLMASITSIFPPFTASSTAVLSWLPKSVQIKKGITVSPIVMLGKIVTCKYSYKLHNLVKTKRAHQFRSETLAPARIKHRTTWKATRELLCKQTRAN